MNILNADPRALCWGAAAALSAAGLALATYLSAAHLSATGVACGEGGGCGAVTASEYARFFGVPVAMLGAAGYAVLLLGSLAALAALPNPPAPLRWAAVGVAAVGAAFSAYLTATQVFFIQSYCVYCLTSATFMAALLALTAAGAALGQARAAS